MTEPLPCPFCGHVGLSHNEGSTFRWLSTECNGCGAQCGEERINTMTMERSAAIEQAKVAAIKTWNTRFTPFPPKQQAEPICPECKAAVLYECVACSSNNYPPKQQAEPVPRWDKPSTSFNEWWDDDYDDSENPYEPDSAGYWAWAGWQAAQRPWVGLTDEDFLEACQLAEHGNYLVAFQRIQIKLKERNT